MDLEEEFISLIKENERIILKICNVYCRESDYRADLYQDILVQLWKSFPNYNRRSKITTWMYRIALFQDSEKRRNDQHKNKYLIDSSPILLMRTKMSEAVLKPLKV